MIHVILPLPPRINTNGTYKPRAGGGFYLSKEARSFKEEAEVALSKYEPKDGDFFLQMVFFLKHDADIDSRIKLSQDSLQGHIFHNDRQVILAVQAKFMDKQNPRLEIKAAPIAELPEDFLNGLDL